MCTNTFTLRKDFYGSTQFSLLLSAAIRGICRKYITKQIKLTMPDQNPIIVLQKFDNLIEANIIKTKLDAYGIPCFLSEENVTFLTTSLLSGGIRLHIFEQDKEQVIKLLMEESLQKTEGEEDLLICPACGSKRILTLSPERFNPAAVVKFILQLTRPHYCLDCETEFD